MPYNVEKNIVEGGEWGFDIRYTLFVIFIPLLDNGELCAASWS